MYNDRQSTRGGLPSPKRRSPTLSHRRSTEEPPLFKRILSSALWGLLANAAVGILLSLVLCGIAFASTDPLSLIFPLALLALLPSNFIGGFVSAKKCGESHLACGIATAAMWGGISLVGALCLFSASASGYTLWQGLLLHGASIAFCLLGAAAGGIKRAPSKRKRRFG